LSAKCQYCEKEIWEDRDTCPKCGADIPKMDSTNKRSTTRHTHGNTVSKRLVIALASIAGAIIIILLLIMSSPTEEYLPPPLNTQQHVRILDTLEYTGMNLISCDEYEEYEDYKIADTRIPPYEAFTSPILRQALELFFEKEIHSIDWQEIDEIKTLSIGRDSIIMSTEIVPLSELNISPHAIEVIPDSTSFRHSFYQVSHFINLHVFESIVGPTTRILEQMPSLVELRTHIGRDDDLFMFAVLPDLRRLELRAGSLQTLHGLSYLQSLYALSLTSTSIQDLSILSLQENITDLTLRNNTDLPSFETLRSMTWLKSLHIERSDLKSLDFIRDLTSLEALTLIRTDSRTLDFILPLTQLRYLRISDNRDIPAIPNLSELTNLRELHIDLGRVNYRTTGFLQGLTNLEILTLENADDLSGLRGLSNLEELDIQFGFRLTDVAPLGSLTNLRRLRIHSWGPDVRSSETRNINAIGDLANLTELNISDTGMFFNWNFIFDMEQLEILNISNTNVIGDFSRIGRLSNLRVLFMNNVNLMESFHFGRSGAFTTIDFIGETDLESNTRHLSNLASLELLSISGNNLVHIGFLRDMQNLRVLNLENNFIVDVSPLAELSNLTFVDLRRNAVGNWNALDDMVNTTIVGR